MYQFLFVLLCLVNIFNWCKALMLRKENCDVPESLTFCDQDFYERISKELSNIATELRKCENDMGMTCGKLCIC